MCYHQVKHYQCNHTSALSVHYDDICQNALNRPWIAENIPDHCRRAPDAEPELELGVNHCCSVHCCTKDMLRKLQERKAARTTYSEAYLILQECRRNPHPEAIQDDDIREIYLAHHVRCYRIPDLMQDEVYEAIAAEMIRAHADSRAVTATHAPASMFGGWGGAHGVAHGVGCPPPGLVLPRAPSREASMVSSIGSSMSTDDSPASAATPAAPPAAAPAPSRGHGLRSPDERRRPQRLGDASREGRRRHGQGRNTHGGGGRRQ